MVTRFCKPTFSRSTICSFASGPLHIPQIPHIQGIEKFKGKVFHSSQWEHDYSLEGKSVASIGTGGSAIQYVPEIAKDVKQLYVFQRTAAWVIPRDERKYSNLSKALFKNQTSIDKFIAAAFIGVMNLALFYSSAANHEIWAKIS